MIIKNLNNKKSFKIMLSNLNVLYIEDEKTIRKNITKALDIMVAKTYPVSNIDQAQKILNTIRIDLIISDINLPDCTGIDFIKALRLSSCYIPVIFITAHTEKKYLLEATKLKLVDYLIKPIDFNTLKDTLLKASEEIIKEGKYIIDFENNTAYNIMKKKLYSKEDDKEIDLSAKEIILLEYLIENNNRIISHDEIKDKVWDDTFEVSDSALKNVLNKLRKKIGKSSIKNISGIGFRIEFN